MLSASEVIQFSFKGQKHERRDGLWFMMLNGSAFEVSFAQGEIIDQAYRVFMLNSQPAEAATEPAPEVKAEVAEIPEPATDDEDTQRFEAVELSESAPVCALCNGKGKVLVQPYDDPISRWEDCQCQKIAALTIAPTCPAPELAQVKGVNPPQTVTVSTDPAQDLFADPRAAEAVADLLAANGQQAGEIVKLLEVIKQREATIAEQHDQLEKQTKIATQARAQVKQLKKSLKALAAQIEASVDQEIAIKSAAIATAVAEAPKPAPFGGTGTEKIPGN